MLVVVPLPSRQTMGPIPYVEHLASNVGKVGIISEHGIKFLTDLLP